MRLLSTKWGPINSGIGWSLLGQVAPLLVGLAVIPLIVHELGTERFGLLTLAWAIVGYLGLFDLGLGRALTYIVADQLAQGRQENLSTLARQALAAITGLGGAAGVGLAIACQWLTAHLRVSDQLQREATLSILLIAGTVPLVTMTAGLKGILEGQRRFSVSNVFRVMLGACTLLGTVVALRFSRSLVAAVLALVLVRILVAIVHVIACAPVLFGPRTLSPMRFGLLLRLGGWMSVSNIVSPILVYTDRFIIACILSVNIVAFYTTPWEVVTKLLAVSAAVSIALFPSFAASRSDANLTAGRLYRRGMTFVAIVVGPIALVLVVFAPMLLRVWLGGEFAARSSNVVRILACGVFVNSLGAIPLTLIQGLGRPDTTAKIHLIELPLYLVVCLGFVRKFGIDGAALAWTVRVTLDTVLLVVAARRLLAEQKTLAVEPAVHVSKSVTESSGTTPAVARTS